MTNGNNEERTNNDIHNSTSTQKTKD